VFELQQQLLLFAVVVVQLEIPAWWWVDVVRSRANLVFVDKGLQSIGD
jgi:hypothetical protein